MFNNETSPAQVQRTDRRDLRAPSNPPPLPGTHPEFFYSFHPHQDLAVTPDGRLIIQPAKDHIEMGLLGVWEDKNAIHMEDLPRTIEDRCKRILLKDQASYSYQYRTKDARGPAQFLDKWTDVTWEWDQPEMVADTAAMLDFFEALAWSLNPSDRMIEKAEERSGNKLTKRPPKAV